ncbi:Hypothetical predicted protein [Octopus vulgaris]|uniref:Uncharacterized protein n=1 Tax=Octopus vulgaris TaxID=6645 RepID=A0AA36BAS2_OCTVU|nr:Hypothetical predicted protein [Octopus vulgaris]
MPEDFKHKEILPVEIENEPVAKEVKQGKESTSHFVIEDTKQVLPEKIPDEMSMEVTSEEHVVENSEIREPEPSVTGKDPSTENASLRSHSNVSTLKDNENLQENTQEFFRIGGDFRQHVYWERQAT